MLCGAEGRRGALSGATRRSPFQLCRAGLETARPGSHAGASAADPGRPGLTTSTETDVRGGTGTTVSTGRRMRIFTGTTCGGSRLRFNGSKIEPASVQVEKLRRVPPADGEDALCLWLPRCCW